MQDRLVQALFLGGVVACLLGIVASTAPVQYTRLFAETIDSTLDTGVTNSATPTTTTSDTRTIVQTPLTGENTTTTTSTTDTTTVLTTDTTVVDEPTNLDTPPLPACPFRPESARTVVDFTRGGTLTYKELVLIANGTETEATRKITATVPPGVYDIRLASFDAHTDTTRPEYREIWALAYDDEEDVRRHTPVIRDIRDAETLVIETVEKEVALPTTLVRMFARHGAYPADLPQTVVPLCAAFDRVGDISEPEPTPDTSMVVEPEATVPVPAEEAVALIYPRCPFPTREGRMIIDFTKNGTIPLRKLIVRADSNEDAASKGPFAVSMPRGTYTVRLASFGGKIDEVAYPDQVWQLALYAADGSKVARTPASRDIPDWNTDFASLVSESFVVTAPVAWVRALHAAYPSATAGPVGVVCAAFDRMDGPQVAPSSTGTASSAASTISPIAAATSAPATATADVHTVKDTSTPDARPTVAPQEVGIEGALRSVQVRDASVVERRRVLAEDVGGAILPVLSSASRAEREVLVARLMESAMVGTSTTATTAPRALVLARTSREEAAGSAAPELVASDTPSEKDREELAEVFTERSGVRATRDTDGDGVTDYDEVTVYGTDPEEPFTAGGVLTDGERILLGLNPHATDTAPVVTESPRLAGAVHSGFVVTSLELVAPTEDVVPGETIQMRVRGLAPPMSFVTLYVYSTPIILTVRTDAAGRFDYVFDETLEDGEHALYVASVNDTGKILAKSEALPFVKTAEAVTLTPTPVTSDPAQTDARTSLAVAFLLMLLAALATIIGIGIHKSQQHSCSITDAHGSNPS